MPATEFPAWVIDASLIAPWLGGVVAGVILTLVFNRRIKLVYTVTHNRIGMTTDDNTLGKVEVTFAGNYEASNLFVSRLVVTNRSMKDLENTALTVYTHPEITHMLTESTKKELSVHAIQYTDSFLESISFNDTKPSEEEWNRKARLFRTRREFLIPVLNRNEEVEFTFITDTIHGAEPGVWLSVEQAGVVVKHKVGPLPITDLWGVPIVQAAVVGMIASLFGFWAIVANVETLWIAALACGALGVFSNIPGALLLMTYGWCRDKLVG